MIIKIQRSYPSVVDPTISIRTSYDTDFELMVPHYLQK